MHLGSDGQLEDMLFGQSLHLGTASVFVHRYRLPSLNICPFCGFTPHQRNFPPQKKNSCTLTDCCNTGICSLGFREASPNVSGHKCPEWDRRTLQSTSLPERCMPAFPLPVQVSLGIHALLIPLWMSACDHLEAPWGDPQPMQVWLGSRTWSDQAWASMVMIWLSWPW